VVPDTGAEWWFTDDVAAYLGIQRPSVWRMLYPRRTRGETRPVLPSPDRRFGRTPAWRPATITGWKRPGRGVHSRPTAPYPPDPPR
jgi:predicted DNA-binding transcriptional regulator AlpA